MEKANLSPPSAFTVRNKTEEDENSHTLLDHQECSKSFSGQTVCSISKQERNMDRSIVDQQSMTSRKKRFPILRVIGAIVAFTGLLQISLIVSLLLKSKAMVSLNSQPVAHKQRKLRHAEATEFSFNGVPLEKKYGTIESNAHCIGENYRPDSWQHKSCRIHQLCFQPENQQFMVFRSKEERFLADSLKENKFMHASSLLNQSVSIGGINQKWSDDGVPRLEWAPTILDNPQPQTYYNMKVPLILYHSLNAGNPGHLVWDDFLPMYTLMKLFSIELPILPLRYVLNDGKPGLWASCDFSPENQQACHAMTTKFLPMLVGRNYPYAFTTTNSTDIRNIPEPNPLICAETALVGIGDLTDHGNNKAHGWERQDYDDVQNSGRRLLEFRNFLVSNLNIPINPTIQRKVIFSTMSSKTPSRSMDFVRQIELLNSMKIHAESYKMKDLSLEEQVKLVHDAAIYVTFCGGGAMNAMLLPEGSSVIIYYSQDGGVEHNLMTGEPARLDWDLFNSLSYLRVHWLPKQSASNDLNTFILLILHELKLMDL